MRDYAIVSPRFWTGATGRALRGHPEAQIVAFYLMTCPGSHMIGMYPLEIPALCHQTGLSPQGATKGLARLSEGGFAFFDAPSEVVWVPEMARFQIAPSLDAKDNRAKGVARELENYRKCPFFNAFLDKYSAAFSLTVARQPEAPCKPLASQDQDQDQDHDQEHDQEQDQKNLALAVKKPTAPAVALVPEVVKETGFTVPTRLAYAAAFRERWGVGPLTGRSINGQLATFIGVVGAEAAPHVAAFYVRHSQALYVNAKHPINLLVRDAQKLHTEWKTNEPSTPTTAHLEEKSAANFGGWARHLKEETP